MAAGVGAIVGSIAAILFANGPVLKATRKKTEHTFVCDQKAIGYEKVEKRYINRFQEREFFKCADGANLYKLENHSVLAGVYVDEDALSYYPYNTYTIETDIWKYPLVEVTALDKYMTDGGFYKCNHCNSDPCKCLTPSEVEQIRANEKNNAVMTKLINDYRGLVYK
eukprot:TRINITY_DN39911_c0_g1_i1.p2 TRINITY_DN39911_c0_g1~~TRINITY_DN39911_c0_g1_i1.p2  ORF type:complete len:167 (+),score=22.58 TRINITY_DN39911_c0_g1_i1:53-553(+)